MSYQIESEPDKLIDDLMREIERRHTNDPSGKTHAVREMVRGVSAQANLEAVRREAEAKLTEANLRLAEARSECTHAIRESYFDPAKREDPEKGIEACESWCCRFCGAKTG